MSKIENNFLQHVSKIRADIKKCEEDLYSHKMSNHNLEKEINTLESSVVLMKDQELVIASIQDSINQKQKLIDSNCKLIPELEAKMKSSEKDLRLLQGICDHSKTTFSHIKYSNHGRDEDDVFVCDICGATVR